MRKEWIFVKEHLPVISVGGGGFGGGQLAHHGFISGQYAGGGIAKTTGPC